MHRSRKFESILGRALVAGAVLGLASRAGAIPIQMTPVITYTFTGVGSGTLNGKSFANAAFTITAEAFPSQITLMAPNVFEVTDFTSSISIAGLGVTAFTDTMITVLNQNNNSSTVPAIGFADVTKGVAVIFETNPTFNTYNLGNSDPLTTAISVQLSPFNTFATTSGNLSLTSVTGANYSASLAVPDAASSLGLLSFSAACLFLVRRKYAFNKAA